VSLSIKRDDRSGHAIGGNKVRALEWLLGSVREGDRVLTVGPRGSTHALATAVCARSLGAQATIVRWSQHMNDAARLVDARMFRAARVIDAIWVPTAYAIAASLRLRRTRYLRAGGAAPLAVLGHMNAALELVEQAGRRECEVPARVFVPFGTGVTATGLAMGFRLAGLSTRVTGVRVVPRIAGRLKNAFALARRTEHFIRRVAGVGVPKITHLDLDLEHGFYGGKYGRPLAKPSEHERWLGKLDIKLDDTYSRKAFAAAAAHAMHGGERTMFWLTFDSRLLA